jgi:hypothetical protein
MVGREAGGLRILRNGTQSSTKALKLLMVMAPIKTSDLAAHYVGR